MENSNIKNVPRAEVCPTSDIAPCTGPVNSTESYVIDKRGVNPTKLITTISQAAFKLVAGRNQSPSLCDSGLVRRIIDSLVLPIIVFRSHKDEMFSFRDLGRCINSVSVTIGRIQKYSEPQSYVKYWIDKYMSLGVRDKNVYPLVEEYEQNKLFSGFLNRCVSRAIARAPVHAKDCGFLYSLQKGSKQNWPKLPNAMLVKSLEKHERFITRPVSSSSEEVLDSIRTESKELFSGLRDKEFTKFQPTGHSCLQASRAKCGTISRVRAFPKAAKPVRPNFSVLGTGVKSIVSSSSVGWIPYQLNLFYDHRREQLHRCVQNFEHTLQEKGQSEAMAVEVMCLPEPGKFRILSKMDGDLANSLQPLQGALLNRWKNCKYSTMRDEDLTSRVEEMLKIHKKYKTGFNLCVSGDYSSATDTLRRDESFAAFSGAEGSSWYDYGKRSLLPGKIVYPKVKTDDGKSILREEIVSMQTEGQLMGHLLSFPLLCTINLSTYHMALRRWVKRGKWELDDRDREDLLLVLWDLVLINGDDIMFFADEEFYKIWLECVAEHSFLPSAGKNYLSPHYIQMNSQLFRVCNKSGKVTRAGYVQQKVVFGNNIKNGGESSCGPLEAARDLNRMIQQDQRFRCLVPMTLRRFEKRFSFGALRPNWYLPDVLGGFGLNPCGVTYQVTREQRKFAAQFLNEPSRLYTTKNENSQQTRKDSLWTNKCRIQNGPTVLEQGDSLEENSGLEGKSQQIGAWQDFLLPLAPGLKVRKFSLRKRYAPMSLEKVESYRDAYYVYSNMVKAPPSQYFPGVRSSTTHQ